MIPDMLFVGALIVLVGFGVLTPWIAKWRWGHDPLKDVTDGPEF